VVTYKEHLIVIGGLWPTVMKALPWGGLTTALMEDGSLKMAVKLAEDDQREKDRSWRCPRCHRHWVNGERRCTDCNITSPRQWTCPRGLSTYCEYDEKEDPRLDNCIWCHQPYERK